MAYDRTDDSKDEGPDSVDLDDDEDDLLDPCPRCKRAVYHDAEQCPHCGHYLNVEDETAPRTHPAWVIVTATVCLAVFIYLLVR